MFAIVTAVVVSAAALSPTSTSFDWVCPTLDRNPTADGMWDVVFASVSRGQTSDYAAGQIVLQIRDVCPEYIPVAREWAEANG